MIRIAHLSDLHVLALDGVPLLRLLLGKRFTGYANIRLRRSKHHSLEVARAVTKDLAAEKVDHVAITGDVSDLALESEFEVVRRILEQDLGLPASAITIIPGNHDRYTGGSYRSRRFEQWFGAYLKSDIARQTSSVFPVVRLLGPLAIVGLNTGVPRLPLIAAGEVGREQLEALGNVLVHPEMQQRTLVMLLHHPAPNPHRMLKNYVEGLRDCDALLEVLRKASTGRPSYLLHGHLHKRMLRRISNGSSPIWAVGATSASLAHNLAHKRAGYNIYEFSEEGKLQNLYARVFETHDQSFVRQEIPVID